MIVCVACLCRHGGICRASIAMKIGVGDNGANAVSPTTSESPNCSNEEGRLRRETASYFGISIISTQTH